MPNLNSTASWSCIGETEDGRKISQARIYCARRRCNASELLDNTTRHEEHPIEGNVYNYQLPDEERAAIAATVEVFRRDRLAAYHAAPMPEGWWITEGSGGTRRAYCSARCARLAMAGFEPK